jgi:uncharacterized protein
VRSVLGWFEGAATRRPVSTLAVLLAVTLALGAVASSLELQVDLTQFGREDSEAVQAMERVREDFGDPTAAVQVILDAGPGGDLLTTAGLAAATAAEAVVVDTLGPDLRREANGRPQVLSLATAVDAALEGQGPDPSALDDAQVGALAARAAVANPQLAALLSDDFDVDSGTARATVLLALLDAELSEEARSDAAERLRAAFDGDRPVALADVDVTVFSSGLFVAGLLDAVRAEAPPLFGLALLVVLAILALAYRSVFDVAVGLLGLLATVVCTFGCIALLGPGHLGWTGPPSQLAVVVPVLLVGLGIDYSVHLTARYREQRAAGERPPTAAGRALHTVGAALVLATAATATGFATTATAPVRMIADFGVFVAVGVVCAFGQLIKEPLLSAYEMINVHPSLLPRWRGAAPVERAIMAGDAETGVTIHRTVKELDAGPIAAQRAFLIEPDDDAGEVHEKAAAVAELVDRVLDGREIDFMASDRLQLAMLVVQELERRLPLPPFEVWVEDYMAHPDVYRRYSHDLHRERDLPG